MKIELFFKQHQIKLNNKKLVIAASGGPDSMALLDMLNELRKSHNFSLIVAHFDHQLRVDSQKETELLTEYCHSHNLPLAKGVWLKKEQPRTGIEAAARHFRYAFLSQVVAQYQADYLLTAHHGDDLLENILLKFIRSGNPQEMNSLQAVGKMHGTALLRPLLSTSKAELLEYDQQHHIAFIEDETNAKDDTMRNRLRHHVVPLLKKENSHLLENALRYSDDEKVLTALADEKVAEIGRPERFLDQAYRIKGEALLQLDQRQRAYFWQNFIWQTWHKRCSHYLTGYNLRLYQKYYYLWPQKLLLRQEPKVVRAEEEFTFRDHKFMLSVVEHSLPLIGDFWSDEHEFKIASLPAGSKLQLQNGQHAKAKKMFAQAAIPNELRSLCLAVFNQKNQAIFVEKCYRDQRWIENAQHYYLYRLKKE